MLSARRAFDRYVHGLTTVAYGLHPRARPGRYGVTVLRDLQYRDTKRRAHRLDIYRPDAAEPRPALMYVHGGAFTMLSKDTHRIMALAFASRGYVVFNINYRLAPRHKYPAALEDASDALLWVLDHAAEHGADPGRIVLAGESAGGNLVTTLAHLVSHPHPEPFAQALFERRPPIAAVLAIYGFHDLFELERYRNMPWWIRREIHSVVRGYLGGAKAAEAPLSSPLRLLAAPPAPGDRPLPPFFLAAGTADPLLDDSRRLHAVLEARGVDSELHVYPGEIHGFNVMLWRKAARRKWQAAFDFLRRHVG